MLQEADAPCHLIFTQDVSTNAPASTIIATNAASSVLRQCDALRLARPKQPFRLNLQKPPRWEAIIAIEFDYALLIQFVKLPNQRWIALS